jgi:hypothetical protein
MSNYKYIVSVDRNYYPNIEYTHTLDEAIKIRDAAIEDESDPESPDTYKVKVTIASVVEIVEFNSCY